MAWLFKSDWQASPRNPANADLDNIARDIKTWGGNVDAAGYNLLNLYSANVTALNPGGAGVSIGGPSSYTGSRLTVWGGDIEIAEQVTGRSIGFWVNGPGGRFSSYGASLTRYGLTYLNDVAGAQFTVNLSGWGGLRFYTQDAERLIIDGNGKLEVKGLATFDYDVKLNGPSSCSVFREVSGILSVGTNVAGSGNDFRFVAGGNEALRILGNNGFAGIGVSAPAALLHVSKNNVDSPYTDANAGGGIVRVSMAANSTAPAVAIGAAVTTPAYGWLQANQAGVANIPLLLNPNGGPVIFSAPTSFSDGGLVNSTVAVWYDEGGNRLVFRVKSSAGVLKTGYIAVS